MLILTNELTPLRSNIPHIGIETQGRKGDCCPPCNFWHVPKNLRYSNREVSYCDMAHRVMKKQIYEGNKDSESIQYGENFFGLYYIATWQTTQSTSNEK